LDARRRTSARIRILAAGFGTADLRRVQAASALASVGNWGFTIALSIYAFDVGGAGAVGLAAGVRLVPGALAAPFVSAVVDRRSRGAVIVGGLVARGVVVVVLTGVVVADGPLGAVLIPAAVFSVASTTHRPAQAALLPALARTPQQLAAANALLSTSSNAGFLVGALAGAAIAAAAGADVAFAAAAAAFLLGAATLRRVAHRGAPGTGPHDGDAPREVVAGLRALLAAPRLRVVIAAFAATAVIEGATDVLVVVLALEVLGSARQALDT
jgi:MFS family permease